MLKSIQFSFSKLVKAPTIFYASCQLLNHNNMAIDDLIFNHNMHQFCYCSAVADLEQLRQMETQKSTHTANFQTIEGK